MPSANYFKMMLEYFFNPCFIYLSKQWIRCIIALPCIFAVLVTSDRCTSADKIRTVIKEIFWLKKYCKMNFQVRFSVGLVAADSGRRCFVKVLQKSLNLCFFRQCFRVASVQSM